MKDKKQVINLIEEIKAKIRENKYLSGKVLEQDFYKIKELIWEDIDKPEKSDLTVLSYIHSFLINEVCEIHHIEEDMNNSEILRSNLNIREVEGQLNDGKRAFRTYNFNNVDYEYYFIGDLHSDTISLKRILKSCDFFDSIINKSNKRLIFLGDYVDRGKAHLEIIEMILLLKYLFANNIYLLRGNHDGGKIEDDKVQLPVRKEEKNQDDDYFLLYVYNLSKSNKTFLPELPNKYLELFDSLCNIALFSFESIRVLAVHGGIPRPKADSKKCFDYIRNISDLTDDRIVDNLNKSIMDNMRWSDPCEKIDELDINRGRFNFHKEHLIEFIDSIGVDLLIRGHEAEKEGFKEFFDRRLFTLFSSGIITDDNNENINIETAYKDVTPKILKINTGNIEIIDFNL